MAIVGEAFVTISPLTTAFGAKTEAAIQRALAGIEGKVQINADIGGLRQKIEGSLAGLEVDLDIDTDLLAARSRIEAALSGIRVSVDVDPEVDTGLLRRQVSGAIADGSRGGGGRSSGGGGIPGGGGIRTLLAGLALPSLDAGVGSLAAFTGGLLSASSAALSFAGSVGSASSAVLTLPSGLLAAAQGAFTLSSALSGIGGALKAYTSSQKAAGAAAAGGGQSAAAQARAIESAERAIRSAERTLTDAYEDAAYSAEQSSRRQVDAADAVVRAHQATQDAQAELTRERERAREEVEDLRLSVERLALTEERARARVAELQAKKSLADKRAAQDLTGVTEATLRALERQEAAENKAAENPKLQADLDLRDAELDLKETIEKRADEQERLNHLEEVGVEGSDNVTAARRRLAEAERDLADAFTGTADAARDAERSRVNSARRIIDAEESLAAATSAMAATTEQAMGAAGGAASAYETALDNLAPAQRRFVEFLVSLKPLITDIRDATSAALLPGLEDSIRTVLPLLDDMKPVLVDTAGFLADFSGEAADLVSSPAWRRDLVRLGKGNVDILRSFGAAALSGADGARILAVDVQPLTQRLADMTARIFELARQTLEAKSATGELGDFFDRVGDRIEDLLLTTGFLGSALLDVFKAATPAGDSYLDSLVNLSARLDLIVEKARDSGQLAAFFEGAQPAADEFFGLLGDIGGALFRIGSENFDTFIVVSQAIREDLLPALEELFSNVDGRGVEALVHLATEAVELFDVFISGNPAIRFFTETIAQMLDFVVTLATDIPIVSPLLVALVGGLIALKGALSIIELVKFVTGLETLHTVLGNFGVWDSAISKVGGFLGKLGLIGAAAAAWKVGFDQINQTLGKHVDRIVKSDDAYGQFVKSGEALSDVFAKNVNDTLKISLGLFDSLAKKSPTAAQAVVDGMKKGGKATGEYEVILQAAIDALALQGVTEDDVAAKVQAARDKLQGKNTELDTYISKLRDTTTTLLSQFDAETRTEEAMSRFNEAVAQGTLNLESNTEEGRRNRDMLSDLVGSIQSEVDALGQAAAAGQLDNERKAELQAHLKRLAESNYPEVAAAAKLVLDQLNAIQPTYTAKLGLNINEALHNARVAGQAFAILGGINITPLLENLARQQFPARARGGPVLAKRAYLVGEQGPELFVPNESGTIVPNNHTGEFSGPGDYVSTSASSVTNYNAPLVVMENTFGPGSAAADIIAAMEVVAKNEIAKAIREMNEGKQAGVGAQGGSG
ncbi:MAG TPA: hypothetical protein VF244_01635 [Acidimicrobiales bacterium]